LLELYVNPNYYRNIKIRNKNNRTKFFLPPNNGRNFKDFILATEKLKNENLDFEYIFMEEENHFLKKISLKI
jgi:hypothetical protein